MVIEIFEIDEITIDGKKVYQIVNDGIGYGKGVIVIVDEWESYQQWQANHPLKLKRKTTRLGEYRGAQLS